MNILLNSSDQQQSYIVKDYLLIIRVHSLLTYCICFNHTIGSSQSSAPFTPTQHYHQSFFGV